MPVGVPIVVVTNRSKVNKSVASHGGWSPIPVNDGRVGNLVDESAGASGLNFAKDRQQRECFNSIIEAARSLAMRWTFACVAC